jgi:hypothetical protein
MKFIVAFVARVTLMLLKSLLTARGHTSALFLMNLFTGMRTVLLIRRVLAGMILNR